MPVPADFGILESQLSQHGFVKRPLTDRDVATGAAILPSKLSGYPTDSSKALLGDGTWNRKRYVKTTSKSVTNTVTETDLLNGEITIGANVLGATGLVRMTLWGDWVQNSGAGSVLPRYKLKLGAAPTVVLDTGAPATPVLNGAGRFGWRIVVEILNLGATNSQWTTIQGLLGYTSGNAGNNGTFTTGEGSYQSLILSTGSASSSQAQFIGGNSSAIDTTAAMAVLLTVINPTATATCETKLIGAFVETIQ